MRNYLLLLFLLILLISCKKDKPVIPTPALLDVVGTWTLYSFDTGTVDATLTNYPCLSENVFKVNPDNTTYSSYVGKDTCYLVRPTGPFTSWSAVGIPGQPSYTSTWHRNGNDIYVGSQHEVISKSDNTLLLTESDTITVGVTSPLIFKTVYVKQ